MRLSVINSRSIYPILFLLLFAASCKTAKAPLSDQEWERLERIVTDRNFEFEAQWAEPLPDQSINALSGAGMLPPGSSPNRINLIGNPNYFVMKGDSVRTQLPYWGERQTVQTYGRAEGINFEGQAENIRMSRNDSQNYYDLDFDLRNKLELLQCNLRFCSGQRALLTIQSNMRNQIRFDGTYKISE